MTSTRVDRDTVVETHARFIGQSVLFINADGTWSVGRTGQAVRDYVRVTDPAGNPVHDDSFEFTALAAEPASGGGYQLILQSNDNPATFASASLDATGRITGARLLSNSELFAAETRLGTDLNESGGIGGAMMLLDDGVADLYVDGTGAFFAKSAGGAFTALTIGGQPVNWTLLDGYEIESVTPGSNGYELLVRDHDEQYYVVEMRTAGAGRAGDGQDASGGAEIGQVRPAETTGTVGQSVQATAGNALGANPAANEISAWAATLKVAAIRGATETALAGDGRIDHGELTTIVNAALGALRQGNATQVGQQTMDDLAALASVRNSLFTSKDLAGAESGYLAYVFDKLVNGSRANLQFTGGSTQAQNLGNLSADASVDVLQKLTDKWLLGLDLPNPTTEGDTANPAARAATGTYTAFTAPLFADGASPLDVFQGSAGTCYLLAAVAGIAQATPNAFQKVFVANPAATGGATTWGVRFVDARGDAHWVTVNNQLVVQNSGDSEPAYAKAKGVNAAGQVTPELWVALIEKAYAQANTLDIVGRTKPGNAMFAIEGGLAEPVAYFLGGKASFFADSVSTVNGNPVLVSKLVPTGSTALAELTKLVNQGQFVWVGSSNQTRSPAGLTEFTGGHAYIAYDADPANPNNTTVKVFNPWGLSSATQGAQHVSPFDGDLATLVGTPGYDFWFAA